MGHLGYALRVLLNEIRRDPLWALTALIFGPLRAGAYALKVFFLWALFTLVLLGAVELVVEMVNIRKGILHGALNIGAMLVGLVFLLRLMARPLVENFGQGYRQEDDSHGSARFASKPERQHLAANTSGLLIGRDPESGSLLRYAGPSHLLTMAPTRTGKGVGTIIPNLLTLDRSILASIPRGRMRV